jgi:diguanylate cyclase (GGDEF)-like protein
MAKGSEDEAVSFDDAVVLLDEIQRLRSELAKSNARASELASLAFCDPLVNLANRRSFVSALGDLIARVERYGGPAAMLFVDVDGLKAINDGFGHAAGDQALLEVARLLVASVRKADFVARLSGDEFGILLEHADELNAWETALRIVEKVDDSQLCIDDSCVPLSVAVGVGTIRPGDTPKAVLARADESMYGIKAPGRSRPLSQLSWRPVVRQAVEQ